MTDFEFPEVRSCRFEYQGDGTTNAVPYAAVQAVASAFPEARVTNQDIIDAYGHRVASTAIGKMVGVSERRVASLETVDTDLLALAANRCLEQAGMRAELLSKLIVTKFLGDRVLPMTAALLQRKLNCGVAVQAFDVDGGVHAFVQALEVAVCAMSCGDGPILIVSGGVINRLVSRTDPRLAFQFGDGAAAVLLVPSETPHVLARYGFSNYDYVELVRGFSVRDCVAKESDENGRYELLSELYLERDFKRCKAFAEEAMRVTAGVLLKEAGKNLADVELFLITENHPVIWTAILDVLRIEPHRALSLRSRYGNTMSAMLPILLDEAVRTGRARPGSLVMLLSLGEGLSGGGMLLTL